MDLTCTVNAIKQGATHVRGFTQSPFRQKKPTMEKNFPRFEFRAWSQDFGTVGDRVLELSHCQDNPPTQEIYFVAISDTHHNIKIRNNYLDVKRLIQIDRGLEQWQPCLKEAFPFTGATLVEKVIPILGVEMPTSVKESYGLEDFLEQVIRIGNKWVTVSVSKCRCRGRVEECTTEIVDLDFSGTSIQSIAIESIDPDAVLDLMKQLGLDRYENLNYPAAIERILGLSGKGSHPTSTS